MFSYGLPLNNKLYTYTPGLQLTPFIAVQRGEQASYSTCNSADRDNVSLASVLKYLDKLETSLIYCIYKLTDDNERTRDLEVFLIDLLGSLVFGILNGTSETQLLESIGSA